MADITKIEWTALRVPLKNLSRVSIAELMAKRDAYVAGDTLVIPGYTFNPWEGCTKVSPGCFHCYAETRNIRFAGGINWGKGAPRRRTSRRTWDKVRRWARYAKQHGLRFRVFCASLSDWLDQEVDIAWLVDLLELIRSTPSLDWLLLSKRPEQWRERIEEALKWIEAQPDWDALSPHPLEALRNWLADWLVLNKAPANVWIGTTVEDQIRANLRIPVLLGIPASIHFLSVEPMIAPVDLERVAFSPHTVQSCLTPTWMGRFDARINWVICGGESGPHSRPFDPVWARALLLQCQRTNTAFFMKQMGSAPIGGPPGHADDPKGGDATKWPTDLAVRAWPP